MFERLDLSALIKSILVHLGVISLFFFSWKSAETVVLPKAMPQHVTAMIVEKKPQPPTPQKPTPPPPKKPEPPKPEPKKPEPKKPEPKKPEPKKPEPKKPEPPKPELKKPEPKKPEPKQETVDFSDILKSEMKQLDKQPQKKTEPRPAPAAVSTSDKEQDEIQEFLGLIQQTISRNWTRPPSARTGMVVTLRINLLPGGELIDVNILESSGNSAFDRSALAAVQNARRFPVPTDPVKFDRYFRSLKLRFNPDDLLY